MKLRILPLALVMGLLLAATPAFGAVDWAWGTLYAKTDGVTQGYGSGKWGIDNNQYNKWYAVLTDSKPGGEAIYAESTYQWKRCSACTIVSDGSDQTVRWSDSQTSSALWESIALKDSYAYTRARIRVCEDQTFSPDDCSAWQYTPFRSYA